MIRTGGPSPLFGTILITVVLTSAALLIGCNDTTGKVGVLHDRIADAEDRADKLQRKNTELRAELNALQQQVETLQEIGRDRLEKLYTVERIKLGRHTGAVDLDDDAGDHEGVKVFLQPVDDQGDALKAAGSATVELYDLAAPQGENLIGRYEWSVEELTEQWYGGFMAYHYALECEWETPPAHDEVTVRVVFTEYLTGKTFTAQTVCSVRPG
ncbi:MAG: hypothetical protein ACLFVW_04275 [Phycisphaerae bacterium]